MASYQAILLVILLPMVAGLCYRAFATWQEPHRIQVSNLAPIVGLLLLTVSLTHMLVAAFKSAFHHR